MQLKQVQIQNYKSIEDSTLFSIAQTTCFVGKNEAGKSALLEALYKLNPTEKEKEFFNSGVEYPRRHLTDYDDTLSQNHNVLTTYWELKQTEINQLESLFGESILEDNRVIARKGYDNRVLWNCQIKQDKIVDNFIEHSLLHNEEIEGLGNPQTVNELVRILKSIPTPSERHIELITKLTGILNQSSFEDYIAQMLMTFLPTFVYFADYQRLPGSVSIDQLNERKSKNTLRFEDRIFLALLDSAKTTPEQISKAKTFEEFIGRLEGVSNKITNQIFQYWKQNRELRVEFRFDPAKPEDPAPYNNGTIFRTRIKNDRHGVSVNFDNRSTGFVWFFSFLIWFSQVKKNYGENLIILLDEPGLTLHGKAQSDLLRYINEALSPNYQVLYTTHSPFMVDMNNFAGIRTVEDIVTKNGDILGTKVGDQVLSTDADTIFPLQAVLGYDLTQTLFVGEHVLLVEGPSDLLYLKWFSKELTDRKRVGLDARWVITPCGGIDKVASFMALFSGNLINIAVLIDYHDGEKKKVKDLKEQKISQASHVFTADMFVEQSEADVEDLLGWNFYVSLINLTYSLEKPHLMPEQKEKSGLRVVKEVEKHFRTLPEHISNFDHFAPSSYLIENSGSIKSKVKGLEQALDTFEGLFKMLNALLPPLK
ncbi:MAG: AAA family ATPase [bacterium]|nr:AAA family ATPase [bacterium]